MGLSLNRSHPGTKPIKKISLDLDVLNSNHKNIIPP